MNYVFTKKLSPKSFPIAVVRIEIMMENMIPVNVHESQYAV